jgi:hypothetical protein
MLQSVRLSVCEDATALTSYNHEMKDKEMFSPSGCYEDFHLPEYNDM